VIEPLPATIFPYLFPDMSHS